MTSKLWPHIQRWDADVKRWLEIARPTGSKWLDLNADAIRWYKETIGGFTIGRIVFPGDPLDVDLVCSAIEREHDRLGSLIDLWELLNETHQNGDELSELNDFTIACIERLANTGIRTLIGSFSEGNPNNLADWPRFYTAMRAAIQHGGGLAVHEYDVPMQRSIGWRCLRYWTAWRDWPEDIKPIPIYGTEIGMDGNVAGVDKPYKGWKTFTDEAGYLSQLQWYDSETIKDNGEERPNYVGGCIFTVGHYYPWGDFETAGCLQLAEYIGQQNAGQPESATAAPILTQTGGDRMNEDRWDYLTWANAAKAAIDAGQASDDPRDPVAFATWLKALGKDATNLHDHGLPYVEIVPKQ